MRIHIKTYFEHFGLVPGVDIIWDEYEYVANGNMVAAHEIHHIEFGANKHEHIENYMALSVGNHAKAHQEKLNRYDLKALHLEFMKNNPYGSV